MSPARPVKLFRIGRSQTVRTPQGSELPGEDAIMHKEGDRLIIEAEPARSLLELLAAMAPLDEDFPPISDPGPNPVVV